MLKLAEVDMRYVEVLLPVEAFKKVKRGETIEVMPRVPANSRHRAVVKVVRCKASFPNIALAAAEPRKPALTAAPDTKTAPQPKAR